MRLKFKLPPSANTLLAQGSGTTPVNKARVAVTRDYNVSIVQEIITLPRVTRTHARKFSSETGDALCVYKVVTAMINGNKTKVVAAVKVTIIILSVRGHFNQWNLLLQYSSDVILLNYHCMARRTMLKFLLSAFQKYVHHCHQV